MANARDLFNKIGGSGMTPKPAKKPLIPTPEDAAAEAKDNKPDAKQKLARGKGPTGGGGSGGGTVPTGVRPKV